MIEATTREIRIKRLHYRSWHRGCKETDILLGRFADETLSNLSDSDIALYEVFLDEDDSDIWAWFTGKNEVPPEYCNGLWQLLVKTNEDAVKRSQ